MIRRLLEGNLYNRHDVKTRRSCTGCMMRLPIAPTHGALDTGWRIQSSEDIVCCSTYNHSLTASTASRKDTLDVPRANVASSRPSQHPTHQQQSPMLLRDIDSIDIDSILEPALFGRDLNIVPAHLPLPHSTILCKSPILQAITTLPLHSVMAVLVLIPELDSDLVVLESE